MWLRAPFAVGLLAMAIWLWPAPAYAYIDPTAAGAALQSLYVLAASALMTIALVPKKIGDAMTRMRAWLRPGPPPPPDSDP